MPNPFTQHPQAVGETYTQHMGKAFTFAGKMFLAACACFLHGFFPFLFVTTGSDTICRLHKTMAPRAKRARASQA